MSKIRIKYTKENDVKFISHLDLLRTFHRAIKRAGIPVSYSQGFNPHPLVTFGLPLPVGTTSACEYMEMELEKEIDIEQLISQLNEALPKGLHVQEASVLTDKKGRSLGEISLAEYTVKVYLKHTLNIDLQAQISKILNGNELVVEKRTKKGMKQVDVLPDIKTLDTIKQDDKSVVLHMRLSAGSKANLKPELVVKALQIYIQEFEVDFINVHRTQLFIKKDGQVLLPI